FAPKITRPRAGSRVERKTRRSTPTLSIGSPKIVNLRFGEVVTVLKRCARDVPNVRVDRLETRLRFRHFRVQLGAKFRLKLAVDGFGGRIWDHFLGRLADQPCALAPSPWTHGRKSTIDQAHSHKPIKGWIDPAIERNVRRAQIPGPRIGEQPMSFGAPTFPF